MAQKMPLPQTQRDVVHQVEMSSRDADYIVPLFASHYHKRGFVKAKNTPISLMF